MIVYLLILLILLIAGIKKSDSRESCLIKSAGQLIVVMFLFYSGYGVMESVRSKGTAYIKSIPFKRVLSTLVTILFAFLIKPLSINVRNC